MTTTQYLDEAERLADRIAVIDHGRLIREGTVEELKDQIGGAVLELSVPEADQARALDTLSRAAAGQPSYDRHERKIYLAAPEGAGTLMKVLRSLEAAGVSP